MTAPTLRGASFMLVAALTAISAHDLARLLNPADPEWRRSAPSRFVVRLDTSRGAIRIEVVRALAPRGADRFYNLVRHGYYDETRFFRVVAGRWAQFGIHGNPRIAGTWRTQTLPDDARQASNVRGAVTYAWAVPNGRTTQVFINLRDNSSTLDEQGFAPIGKVTEGMEVADALYAGYGEESGGGIRGGRQDPLFDSGNEYLLRRYPRLDYIRRATVE
jgi:cyclophilin family peptidyl-prolyl cis-trans isomerase